MGPAVTAQEVEQEQGDGAGHCCVLSHCFPCPLSLVWTQGKDCCPVWVEMAQGGVCDAPRWHHQLCQ